MKINPTGIQGPSTSVKFLGLKWCEVCQDSPSKKEDKLSYLAPLQLKERHSASLGFFGFGGHLDVLLWPFYCVTLQPASFE